MKEKLAFGTKVTVAHVLTYILCGMLAMTLFDYQSTVESIGMRPLDDPIVGLAPVFQIARGALFALVLWLIRPAFMERKHGWLVVWAVVAIVGIFNTPATSPGSIEALIYLEPTGEPLNTSIGGTLEILAQTLLFSVAATWWVKRPARHASGAPGSSPAGPGTAKSSDPKF
ncbi:hypothetical protein B5F40_13530 [Gordonibacter sp. An230]|uniref:hypothetical protein n=1 Tax=Gordonibacter sp. An230 TaxID=1965592 RepID=UPI000B39ACF6|nr:hypothetical protein [Gordonibacter sp. An230]OUO87553.1 hypothetical protein B5F40_13530 [Gordonibacter sp. An230]